MDGALRLGRRLVGGVGVIEEEDGDLLVRDGADVDAAVDAVGGFVPVHLAGRGADTMGRCAVPVLDLNRLAAEDDRNAVVGVPVPGQGLARFKTEPADQRRGAVMENLFEHQGLQKQGCKG